MLYYFCRQDAIVKVIAKLQSGRKPGAASDEEEPEKDSRTNESTNFKKNKVHVVANVADSGFPGRDQMPFGGGATEPTPGATSGQRNAGKLCIGEGHMVKQLCTLYNWDLSGYATLICH